ncbi:unnamed protein product [Amoebophrya sp. A120]|nr:unnamed protein product [Amoebophrya sp. A120]|eukprot:GSA120T00013328001.1
MTRDAASTMVEIHSNLVEKSLQGANQLIENLPKNRNSSATGSSYQANLPAALAKNLPPGVEQELQRKNTAQNGISYEKNYTVVQKSKYQTQSAQLQVQGGGALNHPLYLLTDQGFTQIELTSWLKLTNMLLDTDSLNSSSSNKRWEEILRLFVDVFDGKLTPLLDFPIEDKQRKPILKQKITQFLIGFLDYQLVVAEKMAKKILQTQKRLGMDASVTEKQSAIKPAEEIQQLMKKTVETVITVCLKCDLYDPMYKRFFARLSTKKQKSYFINALEQYLLLENGLVKEIDAEVYSSILDSYSARLQEEEETVARLFKKTASTASNGPPGSRAFASSAVQVGSTSRGGSDASTSSVGFFSVKDFTLAVDSLKDGEMKPLATLPYHIQHDEYLNVKLGEDQVDFFPHAFESALHLTRLVISSRNDLFRLDLNLAIRILTQFRCYTALIYVYLATKDFTSPLELLVGECTRIFNKSKRKSNVNSPANTPPGVNIMETTSAAAGRGTSCSPRNQPSSEDVRIIEPALCEFLLVRKLYHFLLSSLSGSSFLAGTEPPTSVEIRDVLKRIFLRRKTDVADAPPDMFAKIMNLSPVSLFRSFAQLFSLSSGGAVGGGNVFWYERTDSSKLSVEQGAQKNEALKLLQSQDTFIEEVMVSFKQWFTITKKTATTQISQKQLAHAADCYTWFIGRALANGEETSIWIQKAGMTVIKCLVEDTKQRLHSYKATVTELEDLCVLIFKRCEKFLNLAAVVSTPGGGPGPRLPGQPQLQMMNKGTVVNYSNTATGVALPGGSGSTTLPYFNPHEELLSDGVHPPANPAGAAVETIQNPQRAIQQIIAQCERRSFLRLQAFLYESIEEYSKAVNSRLKLYELQLRTASPAKVVEGKNASRNPTQINDLASSSGGSGAVAATTTLASSMPSDQGSRAKATAGLFEYLTQLIKNNNDKSNSSPAKRQNSHLWRVFTEDNNELLKKLEQIDLEKTCEIILIAGKELFQSDYKQIADALTKNLPHLQIKFFKHLFSTRSTTSGGSGMDHDGVLKTSHHGIATTGTTRTAAGGNKQEQQDAEHQGANQNTTSTLRATKTSTELQFCQSYILSFTKLMIDQEPENVFDFFLEFESILPVEEALRECLLKLQEEQEQQAGAGSASGALSGKAGRTTGITIGNMTTGSGINSLNKRSTPSPPSASSSTIIDGAIWLLEKVGDHARAIQLFVRQFRTEIGHLLLLDHVGTRNITGEEEHEGDNNTAGARAVEDFKIPGSSVMGNKSKSDYFVTTKLITNADQYCDRNAGVLTNEDLSRLWFSFFDSALEMETKQASRLVQAEEVQQMVDEQEKMKSRPAGATSTTVTSAATSNKTGESRSGRRTPNHYTGLAPSSQETQAQLSPVAQISTTMIRHLPATFCLRKLSQEKPYTELPIFALTTPITIITNAMKFHSRFLESSLTIVGQDILQGMSEFYALERKGVFGYSPLHERTGGAFGGAAGNNKLGKSKGRGKQGRNNGSSMTLFPPGVAVSKAVVDEENGVIKVKAGGGGAVVYGMGGS